MHTFNETVGVPAFLAKLWRLVDDVETNELIFWQSDGLSFIIQNPAQFARELLPLNYKHNNMASFIRQLNMYGFHKMTSIENGGLKFDKDEMEFSHPCFQKEQPYLLEQIKRKITIPKQPANTTVAEDEMNLKPETVYKLMNEIKMMHSRQETLDSSFSTMKQENEALWREVAVLRQKHIKQQRIVNDLIQFLMTLMPTRGGGGINNMNGVKRRFQLMINDIPEPVKKQKSSEDSNTVIHELTEDLLDQDEYLVDVVGDDEDNFKPQPQFMSPEDQLNYETDQEDISSSTIIDNDEDHYHSNNQGHVGDNIEYNLSNIATESKANNFSTPIDDWLESNVLGPEMIKQEPLSFETVIGGYDYGTERNQYEMSINPTINRRMKGSKNKSLLARRKIAQPLHLRIANKGQNVTSPSANLIRGKPTTVRRISGGKKISQDAGQPGTSLSNAGTIIPAAKQTPSKVCTNKNDCISTEIPNELFESQYGSVSPLMGNFLAGSYNPTLSEDLGSKMGAIPSTSDGYNTVDSKNSTNYAITKYNNNKFDKNDEVNRSANELNMQLESMQGDIESMDELLNCDDYPLEINSLLNNSSGGLTGQNRLVLSPSVDFEQFSKFLGDFDAAFGPSMNNDFNMDKRNDELMTYQPCNDLDVSEFLNTSNSADKNAEEDEHLAQDLNTPCVDRKSLSF